VLADLVKSATSLDGLLQAVEVKRLLVDIG